VGDISRSKPSRASKQHVGPVVRPVCRTRAVVVMIAPLGLFPHQLFPLAAVEGLSRRRANRMTALELGSVHPTVATAAFNVGPELFIAWRTLATRNASGGQPKKVHQMCPSVEICCGRYTRGSGIPRSRPSMTLPPGIGSRS